MYVNQGYIFLQIPYFLGRETIHPKLKLGKKFRREHENVCMKCGKIGREEIDISEKYIPLMSTNVTPQTIYLSGWEGGYWVVGCL